MPSFVQYNQAEGIPATSESLAFSSNTTPGNLIVAIWANQGNAYSGAVTFSDSQSNMYHTVVSVVDNTTELTQMYLAYAKSIVGGACTVTAMYPSGISNGALYIFEVNGANAFDNGVGAVGSSTTAATGNFTTTQSDIIIAATINYGSASSQGSRYTLIALTPGFADILEYAVVSAGTQNATANLSGSQGWGIIAGGFYQSSSVSPAGFLGSLYARRMG